MFNQNLTQLLVLLFNLGMDDPYPEPIDDFVDEQEDNSNGILEGGYNKEGPTPMPLDTLIDENTSIESHAHSVMGQAVEENECNLTWDEDSGEHYKEEHSLTDTATDRKMSNGNYIHSMASVVEENDCNPNRIGEKIEEEGNDKSNDTEGEYICQMMHFFEQVTRDPNHPRWPRTRPASQYLPV